MQHSEDNWVGCAHLYAGHTKLVKLHTCDQQMDRVRGITEKQHDTAIHFCINFVEHIVLKFIECVQGGGCVGQKLWQCVFLQRLERRGKKNIRSIKNLVSVEWSSSVSGVCEDRCVSSI